MSVLSSYNKASNCTGNIGYYKLQGTPQVVPFVLNSGTTYQAITQKTLPFGVYQLILHIGIQGDNTTAFERLRIEQDETIDSLGNTGVNDYEDLLIGTTLPDNTVFAISTNYICATNGYGYCDFGFRIIPTFAGTAPSITSLYVDIWKIA